MPCSSTSKSTLIFTYLSKYAVGCYFRYCRFPRTILVGDSVNKERVVAHQSRTPATHHCPPGDFAHPRMHLPGYPVRLLRLPLGVLLPRLSPLRRLRSSPLLHGPAFAR